MATPHYLTTKPHIYLIIKKFSFSFSGVKPLLLQANT